MSEMMHPTRERLIVTTVDLLDEGNPEKVHVEEVLTRSGISRGSLYHHFEDFPHLIEAALVRRFAARIDASIAVMVDILVTATNRDEMVTQIATLTRETQSELNRPHRFERVRALGMAGQSERFRQALGVEQQRLTSALADLVREGQAKGWLGNDYCPNAAAVFIQSYPLGKVVDDVVADHLPNDDWNHLIDLVVERVLAAPSS